ncbi:MAG: DUF86 domain-containing protein [Acidobacteriaceae bacterium]|nr:DUF86 domain-containing protein [Acidobacteriaceae bacterium]
MQREVRALLMDMDESASAIQAYTATLTREEYESAQIVQDAVEHRFMIIGEALNRVLDLDPGLEGRISHTREIIGLINRIVHAYAIIESDTLWTIIQRYLTPLRQELSLIFAEPE